MAHEHVKKAWHWKKVRKQIVKHVQSMELYMDISVALLFSD